MSILLVALFGCSEYEFGVEPGLGDVGEDVDLGEEGLEETNTDVVTDAFEIPRRADILVFGDTSSSMAEELVTMGANIERFVGRVAETHDDWQLAAVTGPDGCAQGGILGPQDSDFASRFATGIMTPPGADEVDEWGLNNVMVAVQNSEPGRCNEGLVRDDSLLHVIFISDEDDNSPGWEQGGDYWRPYVDEIVRLKGSAASVAFSAVGGPVPGGCSGAEQGNGYWEAVGATEGEFISICENWPTQLDLIADIASTHDTFTLSREPIEDTIVVTVADDERTGWTYDEASNAVVFSTNAPLAGDVVFVEYATYE